MFLIRIEEVRFRLLDAVDGRFRLSDADPSLRRVVEIFDGVATLELRALESPLPPPLPLDRLSERAVGSAASACQVDKTWSRSSILSNAARCSAANSGRGFVSMTAADFWKYRNAIS